MAQKFKGRIRLKECIIIKTMSHQNVQKSELVRKIQALPKEKMEEVADFVDFLLQKNNDRGLTKMVSGASEKVFQKVWDNSEDSAYDKL